MIGGVVRGLAVLNAIGVGTNIGKAHRILEAAKAETEAMRATEGARIRAERSSASALGGTIPRFEAQRHLDAVTDAMAAGDGGWSAVPQEARTALVGAGVGVVVTIVLNRAATLLGARR